ncbi:hypothetical protein, partial [Mesorhizobium sp. M3A.F.Ca.ET.174.01.1.1]|uniref:hypothetical protein n=1 Tax=Mesorhizobium sp. M3A.F.Ca.ET.174.01.1.1 TaxID=2563944 RepID=UPI001AEE2FB4
GHAVCHAAERFAFCEAVHIAHRLCFQFQRPRKCGPLTALDRTRAQANRFSDTAALFQALGSSVTETSVGSIP